MNIPTSFPVVRLAFLALSALFLTRFAVPSYKDMRLRADARIAVETIGEMQEEYRRRNGKYASRLSQLSGIRKDWPPLRKRLYAAIDLYQGVLIEAAPDRYSVKVLVRDRKKTPVVLSGGKS